MGPISMVPCASGECLAVAHPGLVSDFNPGDSRGLSAAWVVLGVVYSFGIISGIFLLYTGRWIWISVNRALQSVRRRRSAWDLLVFGALHFIRHRRRVALAFSHLSSYTLRNSEGYKQRLRRRPATPAPQARLRLTGAYPFEGGTRLPKRWIQLKRSSTRSTTFRTLQIGLEWIPQCITS